MNEVAHRGDQVYAVSVEACHKGELAAAQHPDVEKAKRLVAEIRSQCDKVFATMDHLREAIERVDALMERVERGEAPVQEVVEAALEARKLFESAKTANDALRKDLEQ